MQKVAVIMSAYNGEKYIREQIASILRQTGVEFTLFVRDDGSKDGTPEILQQYMDEFPQKIVWHKADRSNLGAKDSFLHLLKEVHDNAEHFDYYAFADQDDVWLENKLYAAVQKLEQTKKGTPSLYYSNKTFVDAKLNKIADENIAYYGDFFEVLMNPLAFGCTMVFNRRMADLMTEVMPSYNWHDHWVYRLAKCCGGSVVFDERSYILYRQHGDNLAGMKTCHPVYFNIKSLFTKREHIYQQALNEVYTLHAKDMPQPEKQYVEWVLRYNTDFKAMLHLIFNSAMMRPLRRYMILAAKVLLHKL